LEAQKRNISPYALCDEEVQETPIGAGGLIYHPFIFGSPQNPRSRAGFYGIGAWHTRKHLLRALYEGVAFCHYGHIKILMDNLNLNVRDVTLTGGGARSKVWAQIMTDVLNIRTRVPKGLELGTLGDAITAGIGVGIFKDHRTGIREMSSPMGEERFEPIEENVEKYRVIYNVYKLIENVMESNKIWENLHDVEMLAR